jgi:tetratricopeptide (TPR) repeat protein
MKIYATALLLVLILSGFHSLIAQKDTIRENFYDAEFFLTKEDFKDALFSFEKVYNAGYQDNSNINYRLGVCYLNILGEKNKSIPFLEKAINMVSDKYMEGSFEEKSAHVDAYLYLGNAYRIANILDRAIDSYNTYLKVASNLGPENIAYTRQQIESCKHAQKAIQNPVSISKKNLGENFNTLLNNSQCVFSGDENSMAFMTSQKFYDAVFYVKKNNGLWSKPINITPEINSEGDQFVTSFSFDGSKLFLCKIKNFDGDIFVSDYIDGKWTPSKSIGKPVNSKFFESHACLSPDGKTLYFTSNRTGGYGGMDIYSSTLNDHGDWGEPRNLGNKVNTPLNEETPFISDDGKTLYFSSQGHSTIGGFDIFTTELLPNKTWKSPIPLPYPVNSTDDEIFFFPKPHENGGYMSLHDSDGFGDGDLYFIKINAKFGN